MNQGTVFGRVSNMRVRDYTAVTGCEFLSVRSVENLSEIRTRVQIFIAFVNRDSKVRILPTTAPCRRGGTNQQFRALLPSGQPDPAYIIEQQLPAYPTTAILHMWRNSLLPAAHTQTDV
jgi:hypothetical protein